MGIIVRSSSIHAAGCYATTAYAKGTRIVEYTGRRIHKDVADEKYQDSPTTYLFGIGDGTTVIDGHGAAMFINHSCDANCETDERKGRVWIKAIRDIAVGDELTYDYNLYDGGEDEAFCNCGAATCRKTMYSLEEITRRKRRAARKAAANKKSPVKRKSPAKSKSATTEKSSSRPAKSKKTPAKTKRSRKTTRRS
jgi:hypothetical protein